jgi:hypothetical protein
MQNIFNKLTVKKNFTPTQLIEKRESLIEDIKREWKRILSFNVVTNGTKQVFDLKAVYKQIKSFEADLIDIKVSIQAVNMGLTSLSQMPKESSYPSIFILSQLKEHKLKLQKIPTKKEEGESVVFTRKFIDEEVGKIDAQIKKIEKELADYNSEIVFTV